MEILRKGRTKEQIEMMIKLQSAVSSSDTSNKFDLYFVSALNTLPPIIIQIIVHYDHGIDHVPNKSEGRT